MTRPRHDRPFLESDADPDAIAQFARWYAEAGATGIRIPEAVALATATKDGAPSARMVLLKDFDERGFVFHSSYESRKGRELAANARAALLFYWDPPGRQVRIEGAVSLLPPEESSAYWRTRPPSSRLSAAASSQSEVVESREALDARVAELAAELAGREPERPPWWGGYRLVPAELEFWQHRDDRLHDRLRYRRRDAGWVIERLSP